MAPFCTRDRWLPRKHLPQLLHYLCAPCTPLQGLSCSVRSVFLIPASFLSHSTARNRKGSFSRSVLPCGIHLTWRYTCQASFSWIILASNSMFSTSYQEIALSCPDFKCLGSSFCFSCPFPFYILSVGRDILRRNTMSMPLKSTKIYIIFKK